MYSISYRFQPDIDPLLHDQHLVCFPTGRRGKNRAYASVIPLDMPGDPRSKRPLTAFGVLLLFLKLY